MTEKQYYALNSDKFGMNDSPYSYDMSDAIDEMNRLHEENQQLKSDLARVIEQARKNNELCVSDIRILEKALWCSGCENDYDRLRQLRKEFLK